MRPCSSAGINLTWKCNFRCIFCFYRDFPELENGKDRRFGDIIKEIFAAKKRGCKNIVFIGYGEPTLYKKLLEVIDYCSSLQLKTSIITNGSTGIHLIEKLYSNGLNHILFSVHGLGEIINEISCNADASKKQREVKDWLKKNNLPFRTNTTFQLKNYCFLEEIIEDCINSGARHIILLGFLPHYHWHNKLREVAVHPKELRPHIEKSADLLISAHKYFTIRYFPFCHLSWEYWKYVVNARYILFDPWEWDYGYYSQDLEEVWRHALEMGESVAIQGKPCSDCLMRLHCGGWNRIYASGFGGAGLTPITDIPEEYKDVADKRGGLHDLNPANSLEGYI